MKNEICKKCGRTEIIHEFKDHKCEKFEAVQSLSDQMTEWNKKPKGCGEKFIIRKFGEDWGYICGEKLSEDMNYLCTTCLKAQNHSPSPVKEKDTPEVRTKSGLASGTNSQQEDLK